MLSVIDFAIYFFEAGVGKESFVTPVRWPAWNFREAEVWCMPGSRFLFRETSLFIDIDLFMAGPSRQVPNTFQKRLGASHQDPFCLSHWEQLGVCHWFQLMGLSSNVSPLCTAFD